jgi:DNA (cytosine-5)-methyltransferase 1
MTAYYNEINKFAAEWLRNLIAAGLIAPGVVDTRSIEDVLPSDLRGFTQCHFFAGIGVWSLALRSAGWSDDRPVWTGSCPCQPFSAAGEGAGFADERHLWPHFYHLISEHAKWLRAQKRRLPIIFGEQVASKDADPWIDLVHADMEGLGYAFGAIPFPSAGIGAPHIRDRNYWVGNADYPGLEGRRPVRQRAAQRAARTGGMVDRLAHANRKDEGGRGVQRPGESAGAGAGAACERPAGLREADGGQPGPVNGYWRDADWLFCRDGKWRPVEPGTFPLADGLAKGMGTLRPGLRRLAELAGLDGASLKRAKEYRVESLRGYGNAINAQAAKTFVEVVMESLMVEREAA